MLVLFMKGKQITNPIQFRKYFSLLDFLRNRELAVIFCREQMKFLEGPVCFNAFYVLFNTIFGGGDLSASVNDPDELFNLYTEASCPPVKPAAGKKGAGAEVGIASLAVDRLLKRYWEKTEGAGLEPEDRVRCCLILTAGTMLTDQLDQLYKEDIDADSLYKAYYRIQTGPYTDGWEKRPPQGPIELEARSAPYEIVMRESMPEGDFTICPRKITVVRNRAGNNVHTATLHLKYEGGGREENLTLGEGDYRYVNFIGSDPVRLHPTLAANGNNTAVKSGGQLVVRTGANVRQQTNIQNGADVISLTVDYALEECLVLHKAQGGEGTYLYPYFTQSFIRTVAYPLPRNETIVEIYGKGQDYFFLTEKGSIWSSNGDTGKKAINLEKAICLLQK